MSVGIVKGTDVNLRRSLADYTLRKEKTMQELKDCPFCKGKAAIVCDIYGKRYEIICRKCGARSAPCIYGRGKIAVGGRRYKDDASARTEAVKLWNERTNA